MVSSKPSDLYCRQDNHTREENMSISMRLRKEVEDLLRFGKITERAIRCPSCNRVIMTAYSDSAGHISLKCKCGVITQINLGVCCTKKSDDDMTFRI